MEPETPPRIITDNDIVNEQIPEQSIQSKSSSIGNQSLDEVSNAAEREEITKQEFVPLILYSTLSSIAFFTPLSAPRVYEAAFSLYYTGVNAASLYINLGLVGFLAIMLSVSQCSCTRLGGQSAFSLNTRNKILVGCVFALLGACISAFAVFKESNYAIKPFFYTSQAFYGINFAIAFTSMLQNAFQRAQKSSYVSEVQDASQVAQQDALDTSRRTVSISMAFSCLPTGYLLAQLATALAFEVEDTYFTHSQAALVKNAIVQAVYFLLFLLAIFLLYPKMAFEVVRFEAKDGGNTSLCERVTTLLKTGPTWTSMFSFALPFAIFFSSVAQWDHVANNFVFVFEDAKLFATYYAAGAAVACSTYTFTLGAIQKPILGLGITLLIYVVFQGVNFATIDLWHNVIFTSICAAFAGFGAMGLLLKTVDILKVDRSVLDAAHQQTLVSLMITLGGILSGALCFFLDMFFYSNRNVKYWVYINNTAFSMGFLALASILLTCNSYRKNKTN